MLKSYKYMLLLLLPVLAGGCKKYVDLKPEDSYIDEQVFSNSSSIRQALNGLYTGLASQNIYGASLTMEAVDIMSQQYDMSPVENSPWLDIARNYGVQGAPGSKFDVIWSSSYALVLKINNFIQQLDKTKSNKVVTDVQFAELMGEAMAMRAFIQFDLLRLYGPQYAGNDDEMAIPYYTQADGKVQPVLRFGTVMDSILGDLSRAEKLLINDPVITKGILTTGAGDFYSSFRNRRMNYYAIKAIQARAFLYVGKKDLAHAAAKAVTDKADVIFPWTAYNEVVGNANPDRIFSSEVIMGIQNPDLYALHSQLFSSALVRSLVLTASGDQLSMAFEGNENDYRFSSSWLSNGFGFRTFYKYADLADQKKSWRYFQPLIRKSEMYYILAETDTDHTQAVHYLNMVRFNRGLPDLADDAPLEDYGNEIEKEYIREFYGEGQLFYYYKRLNPWWAYFLPAFRVPLPISETQLR